MKARKYLLDLCSNNEAGLVNEPWSPFVIFNYRMPEVTRKPILTLPGVDTHDPPRQVHIVVPDKQEAKRREKRKDPFFLPGTSGASDARIWRIRRIRN